MAEPQTATAAAPAAPPPGTPITMTDLEAMFTRAAGPMIAAAVKAATDPLTETLDRLSKQATDRAGALLRGADVAGTHAQVVNPPEVKGHLAAKWLRAALLSKLSKTWGGEEKSAERWSVELYGAEHPVTKSFSAVQRSVGVTTGDGGGFTIPDLFTADLIELLRPASIYDSLGPESVPMINGKIKMPGMASGASAFWVGSNAVLPKTGQTFRMLEEGAKKLGCVLPIDNDWIRYNASGYDQLLVNDLVAAISQARDIALIRADGSASRPTGLQFWAASGNIFNATAGSTLAGMRTDLNKLRLKLVKGNSRMIRPRYILGATAESALMSVLNSFGMPVFEAEMLARGTILGVPYKRTNQIPEDKGTGTGSEVYMADFADVVYGYGTQILITVSSEASYNDGAGSTISSFQQDQTVVRAFVECAQVVRHPESVAMLDNVYWTP